MLVNNSFRASFEAGTVKLNDGQVCIRGDGHFGRGFVTAISDNCIDNNSGRRGWWWAETGDAPSGGGKPETSVPILKDGVHIVVCQTVQVGQGLENLAVVSRCTSATGAKPDCRNGMIAFACMMDDIFCLDVLSHQPC